MWKMIKRYIDRVPEEVYIFGILLIPLIVIFVTATACDSEENTDPKKGIVWVGNSITKRCDGTTLIYNGEGTSAILNSTECM
jgi:hypothetical protein